MASRLLVKVCCIQSEDEARLAAEAGATHIGLVGAMPSGPGPLADEVIARIARAAPESVVCVLLTSRTTAADIVDHVLETAVDAVQIVQDVPAAVRLAVRQALPGIQILQVVHVESSDALAVAREAEKGSDSLLLDSGRPSAEVAELGGTGRTHDWSVSAEIVRRTTLPVFLAGGLKPDNVTEAFRAVRPAGLDLCSGIRNKNGSLTQQLLERFMRAVAASS